MANTKTETRTPTIAATVVRDASEMQTAMGLELVFANGRKLVILQDQLNPTILTEGLWHGIKQKLVDAAAISRNPETGRSATVDDKYAAVKEVYDRLLAGSWNAPREGGGGAGSLLFKALCRIKPTTKPEDIKSWLDAKTDAEKAALRKNPTVAKTIADIQAEQAKGGEGIDSDALLGQL